MANHRINNFTAAIIIAAVATIFFTTVSGQAPGTAPALAPYPYMGEGPSSPEPAGSSGPSSTEPAASFGPSAPGPASADCMTNLLNMSDCLSYVTENSSVTVPDPNCCPELAGLVESSPQCLCLLLGNVSNSYGISIDLKRALKLPSVCKVSTPDASLCALAGYPVPGIGSPPAQSPTGGMAPGGFAASPTTGNNDNGASRIASAYVKPAFFSTLAFTILTTFF